MHNPTPEMSGEDEELSQLLSEVQQSMEHVEEPNINSIFPSEMSCSQAFDQLLKCYSVGGQIRNYYRFGEMNMCKQQRSKLFFCMKSKLLPEKQREAKTREFYMRQEAEKQVARKTSETVWKSREVPLRMPFREDGYAALKAAEDAKDKGANKPSV